jgi:hypothetical protein
MHTHSFFQLLWYIDHQVLISLNIRMINTKRKSGPIAKALPSEVKPNLKTYFAHLQ